MRIQETPRNQLVKRGGIGSGHPANLRMVTAYGFTAEKE